MGKDSEAEFIFAHVHLKCHDIDATKSFYEKMFNAKFLLEEKIRNARISMMELGGTYLHISEAEPGEILESSKEQRNKVWIRYGLGHFGFRVKDLDEAIRELKRKGADFVGGIRDIREGVRVIYLRGPEDDVIEISERSERFDALLRR